MTTQELKEYIDRVLGNSIRCLLPSYWWKRLFGLVVDKVEEVDGKVAKKADKSQLSNKQDLLISGENIKTIQGESIIGSGNIELPVDSALSDDSYNPVQNSVINKELKKISPIFHITQDSGFLDYFIAMHNTFANGNKSNKYPMAIVGKDQGDAIVDAVVNLGNSNAGIEFNVRDKRYRWVFSIASGEFIREEEIFLSSNIEESDPIFSASPAAGIKTTDITNWNNKVDKVSGKQLSTEDFTTALKTKLEGLFNYDDTALESAINTLRSDFNKLVSGDTTTAIKTFNEVIAFLNGISDTESLDSIIASIEQQIAANTQQIAAKQDALVSGTNIKTINGESILGEGNLEVGVDTSTLATKEELNALQDSVIENEEVTAAALTDLDKRLITQIADVKEDYTEKINTLSEELNSIIIENEEITAAALTDLNKKVDDILYLINSQNK